jgi:hypothetical protein
METIKNNFGYCNYSFEQDSYFDEERLQVFEYYGI